MKRIFLACLSFPGFFAFAGDGEYAVSNIPKELLKNANVVKRMEEIRFELNDISKATETHKYALTILNENGSKFAQFQEYYDKLQSIESIEGTLYDASGKKIKTIKKSDIQDLSGTGGGNLADDNRIKAHDFYYKLYPYTVEYEVTFKYYGTMFLPRWMPQEGQQYFTVQQSKITFTCPADYQLRYKAFSYDGEPLVVTDKSRKTYTWEVKGLSAVVWEYAHPRWNEVSPELYLGPEQFEIEGYRGNMQTWQDFGKFVYALKQGKDKLPEDIRLKVHQLTDGLTDARQKVVNLYEYLQQNTRYISVQLGIGGWQPFDASYVASKKYGDCKALSNYMYALLKEAGIKSYYTLIHAGENQKYLVTDFPAQQFNHVIVCVPLASDSIWLECTSQSLPAGYLSGFTADRYALLIDEAGGTLVKTPKYNFQENLQRRQISATVNAEGNLEAIIHTIYRAMQQDDLEYLVAELSKDKILEYLKSAIALPTYDIIKFEYKLQKAVPPALTENLELTAANYAQVSGRRLFINPNVLSRSGQRLEAEEDRKYDIVLNNEFRDIDSVEIRLPAGFTPESIPDPVSIESAMGKYKNSVQVLADKIIYYRLREQYGGRFPAKSYPELVGFYEKMYKADQSQVVLVKKQ